MAILPPTKKARDANLDALQKAVDEWSDKERKRLENEVQFMRKVLKGRGASDAGTKNLDTASKLVQGEISVFLSFGEAKKGA